MSDEGGTSGETVAEGASDAGNAGDTSSETVAEGAGGASGETVAEGAGDTGNAGGISAESGASDTGDADGESKTIDINIDMGLAFPKAGLLFNIGVISQTGYPTLFRLLVTDIEQTRAIPFREYECPCLADWAPGYCRWLIRAHIKASYDVREGISGRFVGELTPEQVLRGLSDACDMIRQRFELYEESVVIG